MKKAIQIGITGGIGSGKSLVCKVFQQLGIPIYAADERAKYLVENDETLKNLIIKNFGESAYQNEKYHRAYMIEQVFNNAEKLNLLNSLIHPAVAKDYENWVLNQHSNYVLKEAALIFETGSYKNLDQTILVTAPISMRIKRVMQRDKRSEQEVLQIINKQMSDIEKQKLANFVISNDEMQLILPQILDLHQKFLQLN